MKTFKFRIIKIEDPICQSISFIIQEKGWFFWKTIRDYDIVEGTVFTAKKEFFSHGAAHEFITKEMENRKRQARKSTKTIVDELEFTIL